MFQSLEGRASQVTSDICSEGVSIPLAPDDGAYLGLFLRVMERLEVEESRDLLGQGASDVFSHHLRLDPDIDFAAVLDPVPKTICAALTELVEVHVEDLVTRLAPKGYGMRSGDDASS
ncbi:hypothetical protein D1007_38106 [Hordeum vulgare]|nr:hypothetical protein D1007_38106 [Hordeum vulgare]